MNESSFARLQPGTTLYGRFTLRRCLSERPYSGVYLCRDNHSQLPVVLKLFSTPWLRAYAPRQKRFDRTLELSFRVKDNHVINSYESFLDERFSGFSMEFAGGGTLVRLIERARYESLDSDQILRIAEELTLGLEALHQAGIQHRRLTPENILLSDRGSVKIADFGSSNITGASFEETDIVASAADSLAPEYITHGNYDVRSEIFAIGVLLYQLASGRSPFPAPSAEEALFVRLTNDPAPLSDGNRRIPRGIEQIVHRCLSRNPDERYQHCVELKREIYLLKDFGCSTTSVSALTVPSPQALPSPQSPSRATPAPKFTFPTW